MESKKCTQCKIIKSLTNFYLDRTIFTKISYRSKCKLCCKTNQDKRKKYDINETLKIKICSICQIEKTINDFYKSYRHKDGYFSFCSSCHIEKTNNIGNNPKFKRTKEYMIEYLKERNKDINFKMKHVLRSNMKSQLNKIKKGLKINKTFNYIGCTLEFFKNWIEYQFDKNMNWKNHGDYWHLDHIKPCASYDLSKQNEIYQCYNWTNLRPLNKEENIKKSDILDTNLIKKYEKIKNKFLSKTNYELNDNIYISTASCGEKPHSS